jgi:hypothetical protein
MEDDILEVATPKHLNKHESTYEIFPDNKD